MVVEVLNPTVSFTMNVGFFLLLFVYYKSKARGPIL